MAFNVLRFRKRTSPQEFYFGEQLPTFTTTNQTVCAYSEVFTKSNLKVHNNAGKH